MERNVKNQRKSLSLGKRINMRQSANFSADDDSNPHGINGRNSPAAFTDIHATPPHSRFSLDESIEYSPVGLNTSFSPSIMSTQAVVLGNSEVGWQWANVEEINGETDSKSKSTETKKIEKRRHKKRENRLKEIEYKLRRDENNRAAELLKLRCEKFEKQLKEANDENKNKKSNIQPKKLFDEKSYSSPTNKGSKDTKNIKNRIYNTGGQTEKIVEGTKDIKADTIDDFFNDSTMDDVLLVATQQVEQEIKLTQQTENAVPNATTPASRKNRSNEKHSSMYIKFLEDDCPDDLFGSLDDIIAQAMENTKPKTSFQRYNSMPVESMSPKSNTTIKSQKNANICKSLANSSEINHTIKRHASTHDVQIYHPQKMKQIRRI